MRINQNVMAFNASRNLSATNVQLGKSLEKLSSGFRINRAADDAAGLVISQGLRAQIGGLRQATRNAQDGISVVQTAEGALNEMHTMLNRMRELAVQSANTGANDSAARGAAQTELVQLRTEVDRIASSTQFGGVNLLNGTYGVSDATLVGSAVADGGLFTAATDQWTEIGEGSELGIDINGTGVVVVSTAGLKGTTAEVAAGLTANINKALTEAGSIYAGKVTVTGVYTPDATTPASSTARFTVSVAGLQDSQGFVLSESGEAFNSYTGFRLNSDNTPPGGTPQLPGVARAAAGEGGVFQIGANKGDTVDVRIANMRLDGADAQGVMKDLWTLDLTSKADEAIEAIDKAISHVSTERGNLGAIQNRFESMINNLSVTTENLAASESRIRDTDMAAEMVAFTRNQVLQQAGTAMLAQANQVPQTILSLLR